MQQQPPWGAEKQQGLITTMPGPASQQRLQCRTLGDALLGLELGAALGDAPAAAVAPSVGASWLSMHSTVPAGLSCASGCSKLVNGWLLGAATATGASLFLCSEGVRPVVVARGLPLLALSLTGTVGRAAAAAPPATCIWMNCTGALDVETWMLMGRARPGDEGLCLGDLEVGELGRWRLGETLATLGGLSLAGCWVLGPSGAASLADRAAGESGMPAARASAGVTPSVPAWNTCNKPQQLCCLVAHLKQCAQIAAPPSSQCQGVLTFSLSPFAHLVRHLNLWAAVSSLPASGGLAVPTESRDARAATQRSTCSCCLVGGRQLWCHLGCRRSRS